MRFVVIFPLLALLVYFRGVTPAFADRRVRIALAAVLAAGALFPSVVRFIGGSMVAPDLPRWVMFTGGVLNLFVFTAGVLVVWREAASVLLRIAGVPFAFLGRLKWLAAAIFSASALAVPYGVYQATEHVAVRDVEVIYPNLPEALDGTTIVQISDTHASSLIRADALARAVDLANALNPDITVVTGDIADGEVAARAKDVEPLKNLRAKYGVWGVEGNHEHYVDYDGWMAVYKSLGISMLANESAAVRINGEQFNIVGLTDPKALEFGREAPDFEKAARGLNTDAFTLLLSHQPKYARRWAGRADLMLSGHTHGAQVFLLYPVLSMTNAGFVRGLYDVGGPDGRILKLFVHSGTYVWNGFALRLGSSGEVVRLILRRAPGGRNNTH